MISFSCKTVEIYINISSPTLLISLRSPIALSWSLFLLHMTGVWDENHMTQKQMWPGLAPICFWINWSNSHNSGQLHLSRNTCSWSHHFFFFFYLNCLTILSDFFFFFLFPVVSNVSVPHHLFQQWLTETIHLYFISVHLMALLGSKLPGRTVLITLHVCVCVRTMFCVWAEMRGQG